MFAGCQKKDDANKLVVYSPNTENFINTIIPGFEAESGVKIDLISAGTGEIWKRIESEKNNPSADVIWGGQIQSYNIDLIEEYVSANNNDVIPQFQNVQGKMTPYCLDGSVLLANTKLIGNIKVDGYADLLNPALKGKLSMGDPTNSSSAFAQLTNILFAMGGGDYLSDAGWDYMSKLLLQLDGKIAQSSSGVHKGVADGEYTVGLTYEDPAVTYLRDGAPVRVVYQKEGVSFLPALAGIIKNAPHKENAKKFIDYLTSKEAQDIIGTKLTVRPVRSDAELGSYMMPFADINTITEDTAKITSQKNQILERYKNLVIK
jgi:iron(III) transport system substrate-binding protein